MTVRVVTLGDGQAVPLGSYVRAWREAASAPLERMYKRGLINRWPTSALDVLRQFRGGMTERINRHIPGYGIGRKWQPEWYWWTWRTARAVNTPRLVVRRTEVPVWLRARLAHRIYHEDD